MRAANDDNHLAEPASSEGQLEMRPAIPETNQFGFMSEERAQVYLQEAMPGTKWSLRKLRELANELKISSWKEGRIRFFKQCDLDDYIFSRDAKAA